MRVLPGILLPLILAATLAAAGRCFPPGALASAFVPSASAAPASRQPPAPESSEEASILVSRQLAAARSLKPGQVVHLSPNVAGDRSRAFRIAGLYEPMPDPMRFAQPRLEVRLHLPDLIALTSDPADPLSSGAVTAINVALTDPSHAQAVARDLSQRLPDLQALPTDAGNERTATFVVLERFHLAIAVVTVLGGAVFLLALMVMLVDERRATVGTLRLLGFTRRRILLQVFAEGVIVALAGAVFGVLFALSTERAFNAFFQWRYDTALVFMRITPGVAATSLLFAIPLGMAASVIASWSMLREHVLTLVRR